MHAPLKVSLFVALALALGCGPTASSTETLCFDAIDNDENGQIDCADSACASVPGCASGGGDGGPKWGTECTSQAQCLSASGYRISPFGMCVRGTCEDPEGIVVKMTINTTNYSGVSSMRSMLTRIVSKQAVDGSAVTCDSLAAAAPSKAQADADQLATSGKFNLLAWDTLALQVSGGESFDHSRLRTNLGKDFIIWVEMWSGGRVDDLPTGSRLGWTCVDNEGEFVPGDDLDSGGNRIIKITLAPPQG